MKWTKANWFKDLCLLVALLFFCQTILPRAHNLPMPKISWDFGPAAAYAQEPEWLASTVDANYEDRFLQEKLAEIGPGVDAAFAFVRDEIGFEAYTGSLRGARGTMWSEAGNSLDQASLLIALLRAQGIACRYVRGTIAEEDIKTLILSMFNAEKLASAVGYIPLESHGTEWFRNDPENDPGIQAWVSDHWWVELEDGIQLDPSFTDGLIHGTAASTHFEVPDDLRHKVTVRLVAEFYNMLSQYQYETPLEETFNTTEAYGRPLTIGHFVNTYQPPALIGGYKTYTYSPYISVEDNDEIPGNNHVIQGEDYQEFFNTLIPLANTTLTRLTLEMEVNDPGREPDIRSRDLLDRVGYAARHGMAEPGAVDTEKPAMTKYDQTVLYITSGFLKPDIIDPLQEVRKSAADGIEAIQPQMDLLMDKDPAQWTQEDRQLAQECAGFSSGLLGAGGSIVASVFILDSDYYTKMMRDSHLTLAYYDSPRLTLFEGRTMIEGENAVMRTGLDLRRNHIRAIPYPGQNAFNRITFNMVKGHVDSTIEHLVVQEFLVEGIEGARVAISPVAVFKAAEEQGILFESLAGPADITTRLESLEISAEAKARISQALWAGKSVTVPSTMVEVDGVPAIGWYEFDPATGELISTSENGGRQNMMEFALICNLVFFAGLMTITLFWDKISNLFSENSPVNKVTPESFDFNSNEFRYNPDYDENIQENIPETVIEIDDIQVNLYENGSASFSVSGQDVTISSETINNLNEVFEAVGSSGSIIDFAGTDIECISLYSPGPSDVSGTILFGPGISLETVTDAAFSAKTGDNQIPSAFRVRISNTGIDDDFSLDGTAPAGWELLLARTINPIPAGITGEVSAFLRPLEETPVPAPGAVISFGLTAARSDDPAASLTQTVDFTMPEIYNILVETLPETLYTSPDGTAETTITITNTGNVAQAVSLTIDLPAGFTVSVLNSPVSLDPGQSSAQTISFTAQGLDLNTDHFAKIVATYGASSESEKKVSLRLHVAAQGSIQALNAANNAEVMGRQDLADTLEALGQDLSHLYQDQESETYKSRILAGLECLAGQLDDPLLMPFAGDINTACQAIAGSTPDTIEDALNALTNLFEDLELVLNKMAVHDFSIELIPNSIEARPGQVGEFLCLIKNLGLETSTIELALSPLPDGLSGTLSHDRVTLEPGEGTQTVIAAITQPTEQLSATGFDITGTVLQEPSVVRIAPGAFTVRRESLTIFHVVSVPAALQVGEYARVSAWISNTINRNREVTAILQVLDDKNNPVVPQISVPVDLNTLTSIVEVDFGNIETIGFDEGLYTLRTEIIDNSGALIATGEGNLQVGQSFVVNVLTTPQSLPPGSGQVATNIQVAANTAKISLDTKIVNVLWVHSSTSANGRLETTGNGGISIFADVLERSGFMNVQAFEEEITITPEFLSTFDIVVFNGNQRAFTDDETSAVQAFVAGGGGLLQITGYQLAGEVESDNKIIEPYGMAYGSETIITSSLTRMEAHEVTTGVQEIPMMDGHFVMVESPTSGVAFDNANNVGACVAESGFGRVVAFGDENALLNQYVRSLPNRRFFVNIFNWLSGRNLRILDFDTDSEGETLVEGDVADTSYSSWGIELAVGTVEEGLPVRSGSVYADYNRIPGNNNLAAGVTPGGTTMIAFHDTRPLLVIFDTPTDFLQFDVIDGDYVISGYADIYGEDGIVLERWTFDQSGSDSSIISFKRIESDIKYLVFIENGKYADGATIDNFTFSKSNIAAHPLTVVHRIPVSANIFLDENSILPEPFSLEITGDEIILTWRTAFTPDNAMLDFDVPLDLTELQPGENRIVSTGTTAFLSINETDYSDSAPGRTIAVEHILGLDPFVRQTAPGGEAGYTAILTNLKAEQETFEIEVTGLLPGWVHIDSPIVLAAMETRELPLQIRPDSSAPEGEREFIVTAQSLTGTRDSVYGCLEVKGLPAINTDTHGIFMELIPSQGTAGQGTSVAFTVRIVNTGNVSEVLSLSLDLPPGFTGTLTSPTIEVPPGIDNYREVALIATPPAGTIENSYPFTVSAVSTADASVTAQASGTMVVSGFGVDLSMSPVSGIPGSTFQLVVTNTGQKNDTFDISLGGPAGPAATLETNELTLGAGASQVVAITLGEIDFAYEGAIDLIAVATSRGDTVVTDSVTAEIAIHATQGITAEFDPDAVELPEPGSGAFLLMVRNTGNTEDAYTAAITRTSGHVTASLNGLDGQPCQVIPVFRLPGLATGAILLNASLLDYGEGTVTVTVSSLSSPEVNSSDFATLRIGNQAPVADAGPNQSIRIGESAILDGSASYDPDAGPSALTYLWTFANKPDDSSLTDADISDVATAIASFTPDALGDYLVTLTVSDGELSGSDEVLIQVLNNPPVANAGPDQNVETGTEVTLNGSSSFDPDGDTITYDWGIEWNIDAKPVGSTLTDADIAGGDRPDPTFTPDVDGLYVFRLIVNDGWSESESDYVEISATTPNIAPNANAGEDQTACTGDWVILDGTGSNDPDSGPEPLTYLWTFKELPAESNLEDHNIFDADQAEANFMPDAAGTYIVNLSVYDGEDSDEDEVIITASYRNVPPNANAGVDQDVTLGDDVILNGSASDDPDYGPEALSFAWTFVSLPDESALTNADVFDAGTPNPSFTPDAVGSYVLQLEIFDGAEHDFDNVMITVNPVELEPVGDLSARAKSGKVQITWTAVEITDCYNVYRSETSGGPYTKITDCYVTDYCTYLDTDVVNGTTYYYVVRSVAQGIESLDSNEASATPQSRTRR